MGHAMFKANLHQNGPGRRLIDDAVVMLRQHDVFQRRQKRNQMELLKHQAYLLRANAPPPFFIQRRRIGSVEDNLPLAGGVQTGQDIHQRGFPGT